MDLYTAGGLAKPTIRDALKTRDKSELEHMIENVSKFGEISKLKDFESKAEMIDFLIENYPEEGSLGEKIKFLTLKKSPTLRDSFSIREDIDDIAEELNNEVFSSKLKNNYYEEGYLPSELAEIKVIEKDERWIIEDDLKGYIHYIRKEEEYLNVYNLREQETRISQAKTCESPSSFDEVECEFCGRKFLKGQDMPDWVLEKWFDPKFCYLCILNAHQFRSEPQIAYSREKHLSSIKPENRVVDKSWKKPTREQMINDLKALVNDLGFIPESGVLKGSDNKSFLEKSDPEKLIPSLIEHEIADYQKYKEEFGSWLKALIACGIIEEDEAVETPRGYRCLAEDGHECLSLAERKIDDFMNKKEIPHKKEPHYPQDNVLNPDEKYRADWKVGDNFIEYFGLIQEEEYEKKAKRKKKLAKKHDINLISIYPEDLGNLEEILEPVMK